MINANDYDSIEELEAAMKREHRSQMSEFMMSKLRSITADISQINSLIQYPFENEVANLQRTNVYWKANCIEDAAKRIAFTASTMKSACRLISKDDA